jgi:hypothetical protein
VLAFAVLAAIATSVVSFTVDDSYITFAFSKSLAEGRGPVYGQSLVVEGYSNFLWMALVALPLAVAPGVDPLLAARVMAVPFALLLLGATYWLGRQHGGRLGGAVAALLVAVNQDFVFALLSGLETLPYVALLTAGFALYLGSEARPSLRRWVVPAFAAVALTRIDGFVPMLHVIAFEVLARWVDRRSPWRATLVWALPGVLVWAVWFAWRAAYYGLPLPSTYYAKALIPVLLPLRGREYVLQEVLATGLWVVVPAIGVLLWQRSRAALLLAVFACGQLVYAGYVGGDWMPFGRFVLPAVPLLHVLLVWALHAAVRMARERHRFAGLVAALGALTLVGWVGARIEPHASTVPHQLGKQAHAAEQTRHVAALKDAAAYLAALVPVGGRMVTDYGGVLAYYTRSNPIEMWGLCNATIARRGHTQGVQPMYGKTCPECYPELDPEYFHVGMPLVRGRDAFRRHVDVVRAVWQTDTIGRHMDIVRGFASGRVVDRYRGRAVWFLEKRRGGAALAPRVVGERFVIEYPFEGGGSTQ